MKTIILQHLNWRRLQDLFIPQPVIQNMLFLFVCLLGQNKQNMNQIKYSFISSLSPHNKGLSKRSVLSVSKFPLLQNSPGRKRFHAGQENFRMLTRRGHDKQEQQDVMRVRRECRNVFQCSQLADMELTDRVRDRQLLALTAGSSNKEITHTFTTIHTDTVHTSFILQGDNLVLTHLNLKAECVH